MKKSVSILAWSALLFTLVVVIPSTPLAQPSGQPSERTWVGWLSGEPAPSNAPTSSSTDTVSVPIDTSVPGTVNTDTVSVPSARMDNQTVFSSLLEWIQARDSRQSDPQLTAALARELTPEAIRYCVATAKAADLQKDMAQKMGRSLSLNRAIYRILTQYLQNVSQSNPEAAFATAGQVLPSLLALHDVVIEERSRLSEELQDGVLGNALERMILNLVFYLEDRAQQRGRTASDNLIDHDERVLKIFGKHSKEPKVLAMSLFAHPLAEVNRQESLEKRAAKGDLLARLAKTNFYFSRANAPTKQKSEQAFKQAKDYLGSTLLRLGLKNITQPGFNSKAIADALRKLNKIQQDYAQYRRPGCVDFYWNDKFVHELSSFIFSLRQVAFGNLLKNYSEILQRQAANPKLQAIANTYNRALSNLFAQEIATMATQPARLQWLWGEFLQRCAMPTLPP